MLSDQVGSCFEYKILPREDKKGEQVMPKKLISPVLDQEIGRVGLKCSCLGLPTYCGIQLLDRNQNSLWKVEWDVGKWEF